MELHRYVAWWTAPELKGAQTMFLVKLLARLYPFSQDVEAVFHKYLIL